MKQQEYKSTAQILRGKLNRTHQGPNARRLRPHRRRQGGTESASTRSERAGQQGNQSRTEEPGGSEQRYRGHCGNALKGVTKSFETDTSQLGINAAEAVSNSRYTRVRIELKGTKLNIKRWTAGGEQPGESYPNNRIAEALLNSGIGEYLKVNHLTHESMSGQGIAELQRQGHQGPIFDTAGGEQPARQIQKAADAAMQQETEEVVAQKPLQPGGDPAVKPAPPRPRAASRRGQAGQTRNTGGYNRE